MHVIILVIFAAIPLSDGQDLDQSRLHNELRDSILDFNAKLDSQPHDKRIGPTKLWSLGVLDHKGASCSNKTFTELLVATTQLSSELKQSAKSVLEKYLEHCAALVFKPIVDDCQRYQNAIPMEVLRSAPEASDQSLPITSGERLLHGLACLMSRSGKLDPQKVDSNTRFSLDIEKNIRRFKEAYLATCGPVFNIEDNQPWLINMISKPEYYYMFQQKVHNLVKYITICHRTRYAYNLQLDALLQMMTLLEQQRMGDDPAEVENRPTSSSPASDTGNQFVKNIWLNNIFGDM